MTAQHPRISVTTAYKTANISEAKGKDGTYYGYDFKTEVTDCILYIVQLSIVCLFLGPHTVRCVPGRHNQQDSPPVCAPRSPPW